jgi:HD-GYP domain-containing protein (c-di-GMP phosphodiesterase class II)/DNA-binding CsgD family transcriptional regulator
VTTEATSVRLAEIVGLFALGQDNAFGQPMDSQLRSCLLATSFADAIDVPAAQRADVFWVALLRYVGCTGHAHEVASVFGDDIATRGRSVVKDLSDPRELLPEILLHTGTDQAGLRRLRTVLAVLAGGKRFVEMNFRTGCEVGDALLVRLGLADSVRASLACTFEQFNGKGFPNGVRGADIPLPMRIVRLAHDAEALIRIRGLDDAVEVLRRRSGSVYDPALVAAFLPVADELAARADKVDPWDAMLAAEPEPNATLTGADLDQALLAAADFVDLKSVYTVGHSRAVGELAAEAARGCGLADGDVQCLQRAAWVHDLGRTAIPNSVWDRAEALTRTDVDRIQLHPLLTEQMLRRCPGLAAENAIAALHHERVDGSGYSKGLPGSAQSTAARILAVADRYQDFVSERAYRPALSAVQAAAEIRRRVAAGTLDGPAAEAVLAAAGHAGAPMPRAALPAGLTPREVDVIGLAVQGLTMRAIGSRLGISAKTVDSHLQHVYAKAGVSTRGALALFAVEHDLLRPAPVNG